MNEATKILRDKARKILQEGKADVIIGYTERPDGKTSPVFVTAPEGVDSLVWNDRCHVNLARYLYKPEVRALGRPAMVTKGCDNRAVNILIREGRVKREDVYLLGVGCSGMDKAICKYCDTPVPEGTDDLIPAESDKPDAESFEDPLLSMEPDARWDFWMEEFSKCIKCYACRQSCPICHCVRCLAEKNQPQWVDSSPTPRGNLKWNLIRAFHLVGRCAECGECERACPMGIPLSRLARSMRELVRERFEFLPGVDDLEKPAPLATFREDDEEDFFQ